MKSSLRNLTNITLFQEEELKDERVISVIVGVPASVEISVDKDLTELKVDETVTVECITVSEGYPPVSVNLYHEQKGEESQHLGDGSMVEYSPTLADTGSGNNICENNQSFRDELQFQPLPAPGYKLVLMERFYMKKRCIHPFWM